MNPEWVSQRFNVSSMLMRRLATDQAEAISRAGATLTRTLRHGGQILLFGNGGSAANAQHLAAEFVGRFLKDRRPWPALALTTDTSALTAIGNDYGFDQLFARQICALGRPGDVAIGISTSGRSPNVLAGVAAARKHSLTTIGLCGGDGGALADAVDISLVVPSADAPRVQECHLIISHILCELVEVELSMDTEAAPAGLGRLPSGPSSKVTDWKGLLSRRQRWREAGRTVVWTNGCFDLLHIGHLQSLQAARALGDVLVVGI
ncbi:MAG TPA: SIS domain-containing protein, partial [Gemmataceae bacterium]